jgi:hypothetical protein
MKKQLTPIRTLVAVILLSVVIYLAACSKSSSSILGTWLPSTIRTVTKVNNVTFNDTTYTMAPSMIGFSNITFSSNGQYSDKSYPSGLDSTGTYTYTGGMLTFTSGPQLSSTPKPVSINGNSLVVTDKLDTTNTAPLTTQQNFFTFTKQ